MKIYHFSLLFLIFFLGLVIKTDISIGRLKKIEAERAEIKSALTSAVSDAVIYLTETGSYGEGTINKEEVLRTFFASLYSSLGIISDKSAQGEIEMYIPVILLCDIDGYYIYYYQEYKASDGNTYIERTWTEKLPYSYEDDDFIYRFTLTDMVYIYDKNNILNHEDKVIKTDVKEFSINPIYADFKKSHGESILFKKEDFYLIRKGAIINKLEEDMSYFVSSHNHIARGQGITYRFSFPAGRKDGWADYMDDVNLHVVFQGYPYGSDGNYTYNKIASAGAGIIRKPSYYVEEKSWYYIAHIQGCEKIRESNTLLEESFDTLEECVKMGAYCCECIEYGARVPKLE